MGLLFKMAVMEINVLLIDDISTNFPGGISPKTDISAEALYFLGLIIECIDSLQPSKGTLHGTGPSRFVVHTPV